MIFGHTLLAVINNDVNVDTTPNKSNCEYIKKRRKMLETILNHFWQRWRKEYVTQLREVQRVKSRNATTRISENDIVIIHDEKQPRHLW